MSVLGIRCSTKAIRIAILDFVDELTVMKNLNNEHRLPFPALAVKTEDKIIWLDNEIARILKCYPCIKKIVIKLPEYLRSDTNSTRDVHYYNAVVILNGKKASIPILLKQYNNGLQSNSRTVKTRAESIVGKTDKYWDELIADAIVAAKSEL